jgi:TonB-dependent SusC/RagA subfamily outer membrane receptor
MKTKTFLIVLICFPVIEVFGQNKTEITGRVIDTNQKPVARASVFIDNVKTGKTNGKGVYKVKTTPDAKTIKVVSSGGQVVELPVDGRQEINFSVPEGFSAVKNPEPKVETEDEMVNVGYSSVSQKGLTTPVTKIDGRKQNIVYRDIYEMLRGKPGVQVTGKSVKIQGASSLMSGTEPLYVVDGVVVNDVDNIPPQQVRSIEILKGPSASIYGSRGANGVILITLEGAKK